MRIEMWLVVALAVAACGGKKDKLEIEADETCDRLPSEQYRLDCKAEYRKRGKTTSASFNLNRIGKGAKRVFGETGKFPIGDARPPRNSGSCCGTPDNKCVPQPDAFEKDPVWSKLEFAVHEPEIYQYEYHSDGSSFTAYAIGDADCDSQLATFTMTGTVTAKGNPAINITPPPSGVY